MIRVPNTAHFNLLGIPTAIAGVFAGIVIGNYLAAMALLAVLIPLYAFAYLKYFALFPQTSQHTGVTFGFIALQLAFWALVFLLSRIVTLRPGAI
jgi:hypothetical protein